MLPALCLGGFFLAFPLRAADLPGRGLPLAYRATSDSASARRVKLSAPTRTPDANAIVVPPRPRPSPALLDDAALALAPADLPKAREEWKNDVRARAHPIRSLFSEDFSDLQFLKPLLAGKRVVQLGESAHGTAEFSWLKVRLVKFLHQQMGFDVIAMESSLSGCDLADAHLVETSAEASMKDCLFPAWHSEEMAELFRYVQAARRRGDRFTLAGFDIQASGQAQPMVSQQLERYAALLEPRLGGEIAGAEEELANTPSSDEMQRMKASYAALVARLQRSRKELPDLGVTPRDIDLAVQEARSRLRLVETLRYPPGWAERVRIRDEGMAENLDFVLDRLYPGRKVIVWAHNFHISREAQDARVPKSMGVRMAERRGRELYTIAFFMGRGVARWNDGLRYEIRPPPEDTLEAVLANAGWKTSFVDLSQSTGATSWMGEPLLARDWGRRLVRITPAKAFDAVIYVDTVTPAEYR
jgi:erythromycin esterase